MFDDPVTYETSELEHASVAVLYCRERLDQAGFVADADMLRSIEPVNTRTMARIAASALACMRVRGALGEYVRIARQLCDEASGLKPLRAAS